MSTRYIIGSNLRPGQKPGGMTGKGNRKLRRSAVCPDHRSKTGWACQRPTAWESTQDARFITKP